MIDATQIHVDIAIVDLNTISRHVNSANTLLIHWGGQVFPNEPHHHFLDIDVNTVVGVH